MACLLVLKHQTSGTEWRAGEVAQISLLSCVMEGEFWNAILAGLRYSCTWLKTAMVGERHFSDNPHTRTLVQLSLTRANAGHIYGWGVLHQVDECPDYRPRGDSIVISKPSTISPPHVDRHEIPSVQEPVVGRKGCSRQLSGCRIWYGVVTFRARGLISLAVPAS